VIAAVVLAAGLSRRMGRAKLLLDVRGKPVLRWSVEGVRPHVDDLVVVTGPDAAALEQSLGGLDVRFARNPRPEDGQGSSIATGVTALRAGTRAVVVALGDQPSIPSTVVPALLAAFTRTGKAVVAPLYRGTQGTPVLFAAEIFPELATLRADVGARSVVWARRERLELVPIDAAVPADVDTPEDYARLQVQ